MRQMLLISSIIGVIQFCDARGSRQVLKAQATMFAKGDLQSEIGMVDFIQIGNLVKISGVVKGLTPGFHGFHVHEKGNLGNGCADAGGHYNPYNKDHGAPYDSNRHVGDLGNIFASRNNVTIISIMDSMVKLSGPNSVVGRAIVIHSDIDDLGRGNSPASKTTGNSGSRVACGVIRLF
ncbi:hypothetical protein KIN20_012664 [Parelaphostrongylus tenuis]|uniref:Superoxide dismutase [Cu-Zn] n=1 Tax=Parelaphostrongylus tenuis TaxID=148309 RepID=A0AAD5MB42_PARTN|nr:hypothetical protein KIN20_012664 [Parelaphostrongylus tenuis]